MKVMLDQKQYLSAKYSQLVKFGVPPGQGPRNLNEVPEISIILLVSCHFAKSVEIIRIYPMC